MSEHDTTSDDYRAGYLAGYTDRQREVNRLENDADRLYRAAYGEERRIPGHYVARAELEQRRSLSEPPVEITRRDARASWGLEVSEDDAAPTLETGSSTGIPSTSTGRTNRTSRSLNEDVKAGLCRSATVCVGQPTVKPPSRVVPSAA